MSPPGRAPGGGAFIEAYIAPDMHMRPAGQTVSLLEDAGLEVLGVRAMRLQYARTIRAWLANLEQRFEEVTAVIGAKSAESRRQPAPKRTGRRAVVSAVSWKTSARA